MARNAIDRQLNSAGFGPRSPALLARDGMGVMQAIVTISSATGNLRNLYLSVLIRERGRDCPWRPMSFAALPRGQGDTGFHLSLTAGSC